MAFKAENFLTSLYIPELRSIVHGTRCNEHAMRVERQANDLHFMTLQCVIKLTCVCVPNLSLSIEGACHDLVSVWIVERHSVNNIGMVVKRKQLLSRVRIPDFARAVIASSDELVSAFVKRAICQRQKMGSQHFKQTEALLLVFLLLLNQFLDKLFELRFARL